MVTTVNAAIKSTSQPLHTGFSTGGGAVATGAALDGGKGLGALDSVSALVADCGSNCGLSEDDKGNLS
jgi:hypothetical protein